MHQYVFARCASNVVMSLGLAFLSLALLGCGGDHSRVAIRGHVTVDGADLSRGYITFIPVGEAAGPRASGEIVDGHFDVPQRDGPVVGELRVEITEAVQVDFELDDPEAFNENAHAGKLPRHRIPAEYNVNSRLRETTTLAGPNEFSFHLQTQ